ncbi:hypothetical protein [Paenibacillus gorillae]|uniref:hypothetical protein n=1 Tax=Paenibacillus gorillae TaxID=1243662 RepID=UPI0004B404A4|nr:hypothetical protein [Paenibacillus gorillae]
MRRKPIVYALGFIVLLVAVLFLTLYPFGETKATKENVQSLNDQLFAANIRLGMGEKELLQQYGEGMYQEGFGGYYRNYVSLKLQVGIAGDSDHDLFGRVSYLEFSNPSYSIYGIHPGVTMELSREILRERGFKLLTEEIYHSGEISVSLHGEEEVESVQLWFDDKDLRDRQY